MHTKMNTRLLRLALAGAAALAAIAPASASAASGGLLGGTLKAVTGAVSQATTACDANAVTAKTFAPWLDQANYKAAPGGDFESGSPSWTLTGGAKIVAGNASQQVGGAGDDSSLQLPPGASATSPASCVGLAEPTVRMFATGPVTGLVLVQAVYNGIACPRASPPAARGHPRCRCSRASACWASSSRSGSRTSASAPCASTTSTSTRTAAARG